MQWSWWVSNILALCATSLWTYSFSTSVLLCSNSILGVKTLIKSPCWRTTKYEYSHYYFMQKGKIFVFIIFAIIIIIIIIIYYTLSYECKCEWTCECVRELLSEQASKWEYERMRVWAEDSFCVRVVFQVTGINLISEVLKAREVLI
jgi:uncharacterized membrane protein